MSASGHGLVAGQIEELIDLPLMDDPASLATVEVLTKASSPSAYTDANFGCPDDLQGC